MTLPYGVTPTGFVLPSQQQLIDAMIADQKATINANVDTSSDSVLGQFNGVFTRQLMIAYEGLQVAYEASDPDAVEGFLQTQLAKLTGTPRLTATASTVSLLCALNVGTVLVAGTTLVAIQGNPASQWTPATTYTAASTGSFAVTFVNTQTGNHPAPIGSTWVITTPVTGWTAPPTNAAAATLGTDLESDADLRIRREQELQGGGAGNVDAIRAGLLKVNGVQSVTVLNNYTDVTDANGLPPHSIQAIIYDGPTPLALSNDIAQVLWNDSAAGIRCFGAVSGNAIDALGVQHALNFSRVAPIAVYLAFALTPRQGYAGDPQFKTSMVNLLSAQFGVGSVVDPYDVIINTVALNGAVTGLSMGLTAPVGIPSSITATSVTFSPLQIASFSAGNITVNGM